MDDPFNLPRSQSERGINKYFTPIGISNLASANNTRSTQSMPPRRPSVEDRLSPSPRTSPRCFTIKTKFSLDLSQTDDPSPRGEFSTTPPTPRVGVGSGTRRLSRSNNNYFGINFDCDRIDALELIGNGAVCKVYRGLVPGICLPLAIKVAPASAYSREELSNLTREMRLVEGLSHPNIIKLFGYRMNPQGDIEMFFPLYQKTLRSYIDRCHPVPIKILKKLAVQCLDGLNYLHTVTPTVLHRDLKSENLLVLTLSSTDVRLVISDFGESVCKSKGQALESNVGTLEFRAPELITASVEMIDYDEKIDIWAFGMVLYELLTGKLPYHSYDEDRDCGIDVEKTIVKIKKGVRPELGICPERVEDDTSIIDIFKECTQLKPHKRPPASALRALLSFESHH